MLVVSLLAMLGVGVVVGVAVTRSTTSAPAAPPTQSTTAGVPGAGPHAVAGGVPVGYEQSAAGAAQAAGNYLAAIGQLDPARATEALDQVAEPSARARLEAGQRSSLQVVESLWRIETAARQGKHVILTQTPIAYRVDSYTPAEATVRVWLVTVVGVEDRQRLSAFYGIGSATLTWLDGDWRLRSVDAGSQAGDVVPTSPQTPTPTGGVPAKLGGFVPYGSR